MSWGISIRSGRPRRTQKKAKGRGKNEEVGCKVIEETEMNHLLCGVTVEAYPGRIEELRVRRALITKEVADGTGKIVYFDVPEDEPRNIRRMLKDGTAGEYLKGLTGANRGN